jgi:hypothetical protein
MKEMLEQAKAEFEAESEITLEVPGTLVEIGKLKSLGGNFQSILTTLFMPFLKETLSFTYDITVCNIDKFKRRLKLTTSILSPLDPLIRRNVRFILAGGKMIDFCNNLNSSSGDFDLFFTDLSEYEEAIIILKQNGYEVLSNKRHLCEMFHTELGLKFQLIKTFYSCPEDVIENFDIRACAVAFSEGKVWWVNGSLQDIKQKRVVIQTIKPYRLAWLRPFKYYSKGYTLAPTDLALASIAYLMSMKEENRTDSCNPFLYFTDRNYQYNSALEDRDSVYGDFVDPHTDDIPF